MSEVQEMPHVVNPLSVVYSNKRRLVWDARELNKLIDADRLPLETLDDMVELLEKGWYGGTSDLEAGYYQVKSDPNISGFQKLVLAGLLS